MCDATRKVLKIVLQNGEEKKKLLALNLITGNEKHAVHYHSPLNYQDLPNTRKVRNTCTRGQPSTTEPSGRFYCERALASIMIKVADLLNGVSTRAYGLGIFLAPILLNYQTFLVYATRTKG